MKHLPIVACAAALFLGACGQDQNSTPVTGPNPQNPVSVAAVVDLPSGSADGLAAAIAAAGPHGTVHVAAGVHTESGPVVVDIPVSIEGEPGAVVRTATTASISTPLTIEAAIHVKNADGVRIAGLKLVPEGPIGNTAILIHDSGQAVIENNEIDDYQFGVLLQNGDHAQVRDNSIAATGAWQTGDVFDSYGVVVANGTHVILAGNTVNNAIFGLWPCDAAGQAHDNLTYGNLVGIILCKVPEASLDIDGEIVGAEHSANRWEVVHNVSRDNFDTGYLVIDSANNNRLVNNAASGNAAYDIELTADTTRFGFLTPAAFENTVIPGAHKGLVVKDCGDNNHIIGIDTVDLSTDPCY